MTQQIRTSAAFRETISAGLASIREQFQVPGEFPADVLAEARAAAARPLPTDRPDRTDLPFVTLDPASSTDLDQAFALSIDGDSLVLDYAIADVGWFVAPGSALDQEAWRRGVTVYLPDGKAGLYPRELAEGAASLLPDGPRPSVLLTVVVDPSGAASLRSAERVLVRSRQKLGYETVTDGQLPELLGEFARRMTADEDRRGASRVEFPEQEVEPDPAKSGTYRLEIRARRASEDQNATMSLAANLAVAGVLYAAGTGLFRTMAGADDHDVEVLRRTARALGLDWAPATGLAEFQRSLAPGPRTSAFLLSVRRAGGGAGYETFRAGVRPWHDAVAATYAHATAPLRRLADRYVLEAACAVHAGIAVPAWVTDAFTQLPDAMQRADARASKVDRAVVDLVEAATLAGHEGEVFDAVIIDIDERGARIQLTEPAVVARLEHTTAEPGDVVKVRLVTADPVARRVEFAAG